MIDHPSGLTADDLLREIQRLYRQLSTADRISQSILMAQIRVHADHYQALTTRQKDAVSC